MRILFVNHKLGYFGGVEQNVADVARGLAARGHECFLAYGQATERGAEVYKQIFAGATACLEAGATIGFEFRSILKNCAPDVIYLHKVANVEPFLACDTSATTVRMVHDHDIVCPRRHKYFAASGKICDKPAGLRCWLDGAFIDRSTGSLRYLSIPRKLAELKRNKRIDRLIVGSEFMRRSMIMNGFSAEKISLIAPAVNEAPVDIKAPAAEPKLLFVGQLIRGKGVDLLLDALALVQGPFCAVITGDGNARAQLEEQAVRLGISEKVKFLGWVDHDTIGTLYDESRAVVVPSRWPEPFGMVGPEAMRHGRAVVAFDAGGIKDWLRHDQTGLLVPPQDIPAYGSALTRVLYEPGLAEKFGAAGAKAASDFYGFEEQLDALEHALSMGLQKTPSDKEFNTPCESV
jgi:glycosyltransferase involved in cell wall biosynthesis